jgi:thiol-disulfide isomerase/thioredoxin
MMTREFLKKLKPSPVTMILLGLIAYLWFRPPAWVTEPNQPAPEVPAMPGKFLGDLHGKVVLVSFWATWCPYCRHEMPAMQAFYQANHARGFEIVAYSLDKTQTEVDDFMRAGGYTFPAMLATQPVVQGFGGVDRVPLSFVIDRDGMIRHRIAGQVHSGRLESLIEPLLAESVARIR